MQTGPSCSRLRPSYIAPDGSNNGDDNHRPKCSKLAGQTLLTGLANASSRAAVHPVHGFSTQVHQITTHPAKRFEELAI